MVVPIDIKTGAVVARPVSGVQGVNKVQSSASVEKPVTVLQTEATAISQDLAQNAPVDAERVAKIKRAVETGNFPLVPSTIADRLLALKLQWSPNEAASK